MYILNFIHVDVIMTDSVMVILGHCSSLETMVTKLYSNLQCTRRKVVVSMDSYKKNFVYLPADEPQTILLTVTDELQTELRPTTIPQQNWQKRWSIERRVGRELVLLSLNA